MTARRQQVLDAAIQVLGTRGTRQLTHRAVDAEAGLAAGSTSNYFRTRQALLSGVLRRLSELDVAAWGQFAARLGDTGDIDPDVFAEAVAGFTVELARSARVVTMARQAIFAEAAFHEELSRQIGVLRREIGEQGALWLARLGSPKPHADFWSLMALVDGLLLHECTNPGAAFHPAPAVHALLRGLRAAW
ncbi:hypothetical protein SacmaDRAFT_1181 [Saccharomonospora marina XMU15]|uniref:HTH tetR-type domain-containing protein n=1 Tax=Saccharomonospora marina XMU15 TaxID=882083 RepID=H5WXD5_9PSEU|nr:TetR family transcriptional regulator [Saccharomonospora marina]EHR49464.1 hypothetical protein SacmaDRAFT_1181 [Saccharomonospora marina XMU15]